MNSLHFATEFGMGYKINVYHKECNVISCSYACNKASKTK